MYRQFGVRSPGLASGQIKALISTGMSMGLSLEQCIEKTGIPNEEANSLEHDFDASQEVRIIYNLIEQLGECPFALGYSVGFVAQMNSLGLIGQSMLSSSTVGSALAVAARYFVNACPFISITMRHEECERARVIFELKQTPPAALSHFLLGRIMGIVSSMVKDLIKQCDSFIHEIGFTTETAAGMVNIRDQFKCPVKTEQTQNYILCDTHLLKTAMPYQNPIAAKVLEEACRASSRTQKTVEKSEVLSKRIWHILKKNDTLDLPMDQIARMLNMSSRTLSRQLNQEGYSWRTLISNFKMQRARYLLTDTKLCIEHIACETGYSSASSLSISFSQRHHMSPTAYRRKFHKTLG